MDLAEIKKRVYSALRDSEEAFIIDEDVEDLINEAQLDIVARTGVLQKTATGTTSGTGTVALPADFLRVASVDGFYVTLSTDSVGSPQFVNNEIFLSYKNSGSTPAQTLYRIFGGNIETYPQVQSKAYTLEYVYRPTPLAEPADIPEIPVELHNKLVNFARGHSKLREGQEGEASTYLASYYEGLPPVVPWFERKNPGPVGFVPEMTYWDRTYWEEA